MANNIQIADANGIIQTVSTTQLGGVHTPHQIIDSGTILVANFPSNQLINGNVAVNNFPTQQAVTIVAGQGVQLIDSAGVFKASISSGGALKVDASGTTGALVSTKTPNTVSSPTFATVGVSSGSIVAAHSNRTGLILVNTSTNIISLGFGVAAVLNSGITLGPFGTFEMDEYSFNIDQIFAIASGASSNLAIQEFIS